LFKQKINRRLNRMEYWRPVVDELIVQFKKPLSDFQDQVYNTQTPGAKRTTMVREFNRERRLVRFNPCEFEEFEGHVHLSFPRGSYGIGSSTGISFERKDVVRMVRRGFHYVREPNSRCGWCPRESDWHAGYRAPSDQKYDGSHGFLQDGVFYWDSVAFCNRHLGRAQAEMEKMDIFGPNETLLTERYIRRIIAAVEAEGTVIAMAQAIVTREISVRSL
jgi:hypothetical protein